MAMAGEAGQMICVVPTRIQWDGEGACGLFVNTYDFTIVGILHFSVFQLYVWLN